eukprot:6190467-Pleurochrysis_carterae.AAC.1
MRNAARVHSRILVLRTTGRRNITRVYSLVLHRSRGNTGDVRCRDGTTGREAMPHTPYQRSWQSPPLPDRKQSSETPCAQLATFTDPPLSLYAIGVVRTEDARVLPHLGLEGVDDVRGPRRFGVVERGQLERRLAISRALFGELHVLVLLENGVVHVGRHRVCELGCGGVPLRRRVDAARDDQRHARLVDQHRVALVDHTVVERRREHNLKWGRTRVRAALTPSTGSEVA